MQTELALDPKYGAEILTATSFDLSHPPDNILDGAINTFWSTTGSYPQEFVVKLGSQAEIASVSLFSSNIRELTVEACTGSSPTAWKEIFDTAVDDTEGQLQTFREEPDRTFSATYLKFKITTGWGDYATVHKLSVTGK